MNENEEKSILMEKMEEEFFDLVEKEQDITFYLYFPHDWLTERIKDYLDDFLIREAYKELIEKNGHNSFTVYQDSMMTIQLDKKDQQLDVLKRIIEYYEPLEEYEKCSQIKKLLSKIENGI
jgi:murein L,D-transpeptidase YafK